MLAGGSQNHNRKSLAKVPGGWRSVVGKMGGGGGATLWGEAETCALFCSYGPWAGRKYVAAEVLGA